MTYKHHFKRIQQSSTVHLMNFTSSSPLIPHEGMVHPCALDSCQTSVHTSEHADGSPRARRVAGTRMLPFMSAADSSSAAVMVPLAVNEAVLPFSLYAL